MQWHGEALAAEIGAAANRGVVRWVSRLEDHWVKLITSGPKTGRRYKRRGVVHQASAPGEAPASDTATLVRNRETVLIPERFAARLRLTAAHALPLELGTRTMAPRPHARRALRETEAAGQGDVMDEIRAVLR